MKPRMHQVGVNMVMESTGIALVLHGHVSASSHLSHLSEGYECGDGRELG